MCARKSVLGTQQGSSISELAVAVTTVQAKADQILSWRGQVGSNLIPSQGAIGIDGCWEQETLFYLRVLPLVG